MKIIPVIDILGGQVVHGVGGQREHYRPIESRLTRSTQPADVAKALCETFGVADLYVADLDAIMDPIAGAAVATEGVARLAELNVRLWVDVGVRGAGDIGPLLDSGVDQVIVALETLADPATLEACLQTGEAGRTVFSLDMRDGVPVCAAGSWGQPTAEQVAELAIGAGASRVILLDLTRVGRGAGTGTLGLAQRLLQAYSDLEVIVGGGIHEIGQLRAWHEAGAWGVLLATALHDGSVTPAEVESIRSG